MTAQLLHLSPETRLVAAANNRTRISYIRRDRFIDHAGVQPAKTRILSLLDRPRTVRPQCILLASEAGSGKTALLRHLQRLYPDVDDRESQRVIRRVIYCEVEPAPTPLTLQVGLLTELGVPPVPLRRRDLRNDLIRRYLSEFGVELVLFDEVQHVLALSLRERMLELDWMKWISTAGKASVVLSAAMASGRRLIEHDPQLLTRFSEISIPRFAAGPALGQFLLTLERSLPLRRASGLSERSMQQAILGETDAMQGRPGLTDGVVKVVQEAAVAAVRRGTERIALPELSAWRDGEAVLLRHSRQRRKARAENPPGEAAAAAP
ncbi:MAG TPA: TniB family NTP-binding protein [Candidatus Acidoferrales bacterium]|nr:TniB family NTP-binding protein [Candidatus Acidoferrales bacterium]